MVGVVDELRKNDPARTRICIGLRLQTSDTAVAQALQQNPFVTEIDLCLIEEQRAEWNSLLRVIAMRANLEKVTLEDGAVTVEERTAHAALVRSTLRAIQQNTAIRNVELDLYSLHLPTDISTFVDNASSITSLSLYDCDMEPGEREQGARNLAAALQRNKNIQSLGLNRLNDIYTIPILEGLRSNVFLKTFIWTPAYSATGESEISDATSHALQHLLGSTSSIQKIELICTTFNERQFSSIAQAITGSECISELRFLWCRFPEQSSITHFRSILQNKRNLTSLCLEYCNFGGGQVHEDIISVISQPGSLLRCFEFQSCRPLEEAFPGVQYKNLLRAIEKSKLERFRIQSFGTLQQLQTLTQSIPAMKLKELEVRFFQCKMRKKAVSSRQSLKDCATRSSCLGSAGLTEKPSGRIYFTL